VPLGVDTKHYRYLYLTLKTQQGVEVRLAYRKNAHTLEVEDLVPINPNEESQNYASVLGIPFPCISTTDYYTFIFDLNRFNKVDFIQISLRVFAPQHNGNYTVSIKNIVFSKYLPLTHWNLRESLQLLLGQEDPTKIALVDTLKAVLWSEEKPPIIISDEINPVTFHLSVINAKTPFLLVSTIVYDPGWIAEVDGNQLEHVKVNGAFNGWIVNKTGSFNIKIYYRTQRYIEFLLCISGAFILLICIILFLQALKPLIRQSSKIFT
jgi:hypothetical protein